MAQPWAITLETEDLHSSCVVIVACSVLSRLFFHMSYVFFFFFWQSLHQHPLAMYSWKSFANRARQHSDATAAFLKVSGWTDVQTHAMADISTCQPADFQVGIDTEKVVGGGIGKQSQVISARTSGCTTRVLGQKAADLGFVGPEKPGRMVWLKFWDVLRLNRTILRGCLIHFVMGPHQWHSPAFFATRSSATNDSHQWHSPKAQRVRWMLLLPWPLRDDHQKSRRIIAAILLFRWASSIG